MRKSRYALLRSANTNLLQQLDYPPPHLPAPQAAMEPQGLGNLRPGRKGRVERRHGVMEDHGNLRPTYLAQVFSALVQQILPVKQNLPAHDPTSRFREQ